MSEKQFDDFVKKRFKDYVANVSPNVWENIIAKRGKKKPTAFWLSLSAYKSFFLSCVILLGCFSVTWMLISHNVRFKATANKTNNVAIKSNESNNTNRVSHSSLISNSNEESTLTPSLDNNDLVQQVKSERESKTLSEQVGITITNQEKSTNNQSTKEASSIINEGNNLPANQTPNIAYQKKSIHSLIQNDVQDNDIVSDENNTGTRRTSVSSLLPRRWNGLQKGIPNQDFANISLQKNQAPVINLPECPTVEKTPPRSKDYIEIYGSPDYGIRSMSDNTDPQYLKSRDSSSKFSSGYSLGIRYTKVFNTGMSLRAGINYSQINEWFTPAKDDTLSVLINSVTHDTTSVQFKHSYNHYSTLDIPITIGYEFSMGSKFIANFNAGPVINLYSWQNGDVLRTDDSTVHITTSSAPTSPYQFKTNIGLGLTVNASIYYKFNDIVSIFAEPYCRYNFQPMTQDGAELTEKYTTIGLHFGLRLDLH